MSIYAMSDIHGRYEKFNKMLEKIHFSDNDTLYILGDIIDRGEDGIKILADVMEKENVILLMGNHEYMMLNTFYSIKTSHCGSEMEVLLLLKNF